MNEFELKYGCNPNQKPAKVFVAEGDLPFEVLNGRPGYINLLDALNGWQQIFPPPRRLNTSVPPAQLLPNRLMMSSKKFISLMMWNFHRKQRLTFAHAARTV